MYAANNLPRPWTRMPKQGHTASGHAQQQVVNVHVNVGAAPARTRRRPSPAESPAMPRIVGGPSIVYQSPVPIPNTTEPASPLPAYFQAAETNRQAAEEQLREEVRQQFESLHALATAAAPMPTPMQAMQVQPQDAAGPSEPPTPAAAAAGVRDVMQEMPDAGQAAASFDDVRGLGPADWGPAPSACGGPGGGQAGC